MPAIRPALVFLLSACLSAACNSIGNAQTYSWLGAGSGNRWSTPGNWVGGTVPASSLTNTTIEFSSSASGSFSNRNNLSGLQIFQLQVSDPGGNITVSGNPIAIGGGGVDLSSAIRDLTVSANIVVAADQMWTVADGRTLTVTGLVSGISGSPGLTKSGGGTVILSRANTFTGSTDVTAGTLSVANRLSSDVTIRAGGTAVGTGTSSFGANSTIRVEASSADKPDGLFQVQQTFTIGGLSGDGIVENGRPGNRNLTIASNSNTTFSGVIQNGAAGGLGITKSGTGTLTLSGSNTYTRPTTITGGVLEVTVLANGGSASSIGAASTSAGNLVINGGTLRYTGSGDTTNRLFSIGNQGGTIDASGSGAVAFLGTGNISASGTGNRTLTLTGNTSDANTIRSVIRNPSSGRTSVEKTGTGTWVLTGRNTYTGGTTIREGTLRLGAANVLADAGAISLSGGTLAVGYNDTVGALTVASPSTLALDNRTFSLIFTGIDGSYPAFPTSAWLTVTGWQGVPEQTGSRGKILFSNLGSDPNQAYANFLSGVQFSGYSQGEAQFIASTGGRYELVPTPVPEPLGVIGIAAVGLAVGFRRRLLGKHHRGTASGT